MDANFIKYTRLNVASATLLMLITTLKNNLEAKKQLDKGTTAKLYTATSALALVLDNPVPSNVYFPQAADLIGTLDTLPIFKAGLAGNKHNYAHNIAIQIHGMYNNDAMTPQHIDSHIWMINYLTYCYFNITREVRRFNFDINKVLNEGGTVNVAALEPTTVNMPVQRRVV